MYTKELREARFKLVVFAILVTISTTTNTLFYPFTSGLGSSTRAGLPASIASQMQHMFSSFDLYMWSNWFQINGAVYLTLFATLLGTSLIAGEVSRGSIFFLLSRPISRDRVLLTKYGISALLMLMIALLGTSLVFTVGAMAGHSLDLPRMLMATLLVWLGALFVLSLALLCSVLFSDVLRPALVALGVTVVLALPAFMPTWQNWSLIFYWSSADAYFKGVFPLTNLLVNLTAAALPLIVSLVLFRKKAY